MIQHYFLEGKYLGNAPRGKVFVHGELQNPYSYLWFCCKCGEVYAKAPITPESPSIEWSSIRGVCRKHSNGWQAPGALNLSWDRDFMAALPASVLTAELLAQIDFMEAKIEGQKNPDNPRVG